jgi:hypothetical protein
MRIPRRLLVVGFAGLTATVNACAAPPVSPLPIQPSVAGPSATATASVSPSASPTRTPGRLPAAPPTRPAPEPEPSQPEPATSTTGSCYGAIRYDLHIQTTELALLPSMCFAVGAILAVRNIGPGELTVEPEELVSRSYEAAVEDIRFVRAGTVSVMIPQGDQTHTITVVIR